MDLALVVMAAGLGSRFGGNKQLVEVGPTGEVFFDFAIADAVGAGADARRAHRAARVRATRCAITSKRVTATHFACSTCARTSSARSAPSRGAPRMRCSPWPRSYASRSWSSTPTTTTARSPTACSPSRCRWRRPTPRCSPAFRLGNTLPREGTVSRGVCRVERRPSRRASSRRTASGAPATARIVSTDPVGRHHRRHAGVDEHVGLRARALRAPRRACGRVLREAQGRSEDRVPVADDGGRAARRRAASTSRVVHTDDEWIGVTNPDDLEPARARLHALRG